MRWGSVWRGPLHTAWQCPQTPSAPSPPTEARAPQDGGRTELAAEKVRLSRLQSDLQLQSRLLEERAVDAQHTLGLAEQGAQRWSTAVSELQDTRRLRLEVGSWTEAAEKGVEEGGRMCGWMGGLLVHRLRGLRPEVLSFLSENGIMSTPRSTSTPRRS